MTREAKGPVLVYGEVLVDMFLDAVDYPRKGEPVFQYIGVSGGAPCNVAAYLGSLDHPVGLVASFADDKIGDELKTMLAERGIDLSRCFTHPQTRSPLAIVMSSPDGDRQFRLYLSGSAVESIEPDAVRQINLEGGWFHFGSVLLSFPNSKRATEVLLSKIKASEIVRSYDINIRPDIWVNSEVSSDILVSILGSVDVLKVSEEDLEWVQSNLQTDIKDPSDFLDYGCKLIAFTRGKEGARLYARGLEVGVAAPNVDVVDTTGAGDAFMAGLIYALRSSGYTARSCLLGKLNRADLKRCGDFAAMCSGKAVSQKGAMPRI